MSFTPPPYDPKGDGWTAPGVSNTVPAAAAAGVRIMKDGKVLATGITSVNLAGAPVTVTIGPEGRANIEVSGAAPRKFPIAARGYGPQWYRNVVEYWPFNPLHQRFVDDEVVLGRPHGYEAWGDDLQSVAELWAGGHHLGDAEEFPELDVFPYEDAGVIATAIAGAAAAGVAIAFRVNPESTADPEFPFYSNVVHIKDDDRILFSVAVNRFKAAYWHTKADGSAEVAVEIPFLAEIPIDDTADHLLIVARELLEDGTRVVCWLDKIYQGEEIELDDPAITVADNPRVVFEGSFDSTSIPDFAGGFARVHSGEWMLFTSMPTDGEVALIEFSQPLPGYELTATGAIAMRGMPSGSPALSDVGLVEAAQESGLDIRPTGDGMAELFARQATEAQRGTMVFAPHGGTAALTGVQADDPRLAAILDPLALEILFGHGG